MNQKTDVNAAPVQCVVIFGEGRSHMTRYVLGLYALLITVALGCANTQPPSDIEVQRHDFDGHTYVIFSRPNWVGVSAVHSPDCECQSR